jgi:hypothetical protein
VIYQDILDSSALEQYALALNSRAGQARAKGRLTVDELRDRVLASAGRCEWCGLSLVNSEFELDHVLSLKQGGANRAANLVVACPDCNRRKGLKHPARFAAEIHLETGRKTELLRRVSQRYGIEPVRQMSLFADEAPEPESPIHTDAGQIRYSWAE